MKSHDCHVMITQILLVAVRGIMDTHIRETLIGLCNFFHVITQKSITLKKLARL
jgi:accessory gene regulator protein AgrB